MRAGRTAPRAAVASGRRARPTATASGGSPATSHSVSAPAPAPDGLDKPFWMQFWLFLVHALSGDLGRSFVHGIPAAELIFSRMPATLELAGVALILSIGLGIPLGLLAGLAPKSFLSRSIMTGSIFGFSLPNFWLGLMLILAFSVELKWLPAGGRGDTREIFGVSWSFLTLDGLRHLILPALTLAIYKASGANRAYLDVYPSRALGRWHRPR